MEQTATTVEIAQTEKTERRKYTPQERADKAKQRLERAKKCVALAATNTRKYEAKKNFVLGAALQEIAAKDWKFGKAMRQLVAQIEERDRAMFNNFPYAPPPAKAE